LTLDGSDPPKKDSLLSLIIPTIADVSILSKFGKLLLQTTPSTNFELLKPDNASGIEISNHSYDAHSRPPQLKAWTSPGGRFERATEDPPGVSNTKDSYWPCRETQPKAGGLKSLVSKKNDPD